MNREMLHREKGSLFTTILFLVRLVERRCHYFELMRVVGTGVVAQFGAWIVSNSAGAVPQTTTNI